MEKTWIVIADEGRARILEERGPGIDLADVEEMTDAAAHAHNADLRRDAYGRRGGATLASAGEEKLDHEAELFARRVADYLLDAHNKRRFDHLRIVAVPRFLGRLRKELDPQLAKAVTEEIDKDLLQLTTRELTQRLVHEAPHA